MPLGIYSPSAILKSTVILNNDQVKKLPTAPVGITSAPGPGKFFNLLIAVLTTNLNVAYSNISDQDFITIHTTGDLVQLGYIFNLAAQSVTALTVLLTTVSFTKLMVLLPLNIGSATIATSWGVVPILNSVPENEGIEIWAQTAAGNFTGGNVNNTMKVTVYYTIEDLT